MEDDNPTQNEEVKGTPIVPEEMYQESEGQVIDETGFFADALAKNKNDTTDNQPEDPADDQEDEEQEEIPQTQALESFVTTDDPGEYVPKDYSFDVTIFSDDGKKSKTVKIDSIDKFDELLESDADFGSPAALLKAQRLAAKMDANQERDKAAWQVQKDQYDAEVEQETSMMQSINDRANEINYLVAKGKLPAADPKYAAADWSDPEIAKQPGIKEQMQLLDYMVKENQMRVKSGLQPLVSVLDAYNSMQLEQRDKKAADAAKRAGEARKNASARVAGSSPAPVSNVPKGIAVGRGGSLRDLSAGWGVLN